MTRPTGSSARRLLLLAAALWGSAAVPCTRDAMLVFDGSGSMAELGANPAAPTRIEDARRALARALPEIAAVRRIGLMTYGPGGSDSCSGMSLAFAPRPDAAGAVQAAVDALAPAGLTPLAAAVEAAAEVLSYRDTPGIVVLVTDGNETCGGRPCALSARLAATAQDLTVHVVGFRLFADPFTWDNPEQTRGEDTVARCLADRTGGLFVETDTIEELAAALRETLGCALIGGAQPSPRRSVRYASHTTSG